MKDLDSKIIYILIFLALSLPLIFGIRLQPVEMDAANKVYLEIDALQKEVGHFVLIALDYGPGTEAENESQAELVIEHLFRKGVPFAVISTYQLASPTLRELPKRVAANLVLEGAIKEPKYGVDWVNLGFQPGGSLTIQKIAKTDSIAKALKSDADGRPLKELAFFKGENGLTSVQLFAQITGLVGTFNSWVQFLQGATYRPPFIHGCTSITIPDAYLYFSAGQLKGFFEGVAGAAWYDALLQKNFPTRKKQSNAIEVNSGLAFAQIAILVLILVGNLSELKFKKSAR